MHGSENEDDDRWRFDKHVSVGHIITTVAIIIGALSWGSRVESRTAVVENTVSIQAATNQKEFMEIKETLRRIEDKLERKADRKYQ